jgi:hypothetical protein
MLDCPDSKQMVTWLMSGYAVDRCRNASNKLCGEYKRQGSPPRQAKKRTGGPGDSEGNDGTARRDWLWWHER